MQRKTSNGSSRQHSRNGLARGTTGIGHSLAGTRSADALAVLSFHKIGEPPEDGWDTWFYIRESAFIEQLRRLRDENWQVIDAATFLRGLRQPECLPSRAALLTFDDGCRQFLDVAFPCLQSFGYPAVQFLPTAFIGGRNSFDAENEPKEPIFCWNDLRTLERHGISIQSHGVTHRSFSELSVGELRDEIVRSKAVLEDGLGKPIEIFAYPSGDVGASSSVARLALRLAGYRAAFLYGGGPVGFPITDPYRLPRLAMGPDTDLPRLLCR
jgi:peptidoglycan/xylan/chitin deacetylase (PgdA/CDA1 family)